MNKCLTLLTILLINLCVTACGTVVSDTSYKCPPLTEYSADEQSSVEGIWDNYPQATQKMLTDYGRMRKECRAIK